LVPLRLENGCSLLVGGVRAGLGLGETVASDLFAVGVGRNVLLLLRVAPEAQDGIAKADPGNLLDHNRIGDMVEPGAAVLFRNVDAGKSQLGGFLEGVVGELTGFVDFVGKRFDFVVRELARGLLDHPVLFAQFQVHHALLSGRYFDSKPPRKGRQDGVYLLKWARSFLYVTGSSSGSIRVSATVVMKLVSPAQRGSTCMWM
jgi:hypothetical protein